MKKIVSYALAFIISIILLPMDIANADTGGVGVYPSYVQDKVIPGEYFDKDLNVVNKSAEEVKVSISHESDIDTEVVFSDTELIIEPGGTKKFNVKTLIRDEDKVAEQIVKVHINIKNSSSSGVSVNSILEVPVILKNKLATGTMDFELGDSGFRGDTTEIGYKTLFEMVLFNFKTWKSVMNDDLVFNRGGKSTIDLKKDSSLEFYCEVFNKSPFTFVATSNTLMYPSFVDLDDIGDNQPSLNANVGNLLIKSEGMGEAKFKLKPTDVYKLKSEYDSYNLVTKVSLKDSDEVKEITTYISFGSVRYIFMVSAVVIILMMISLLFLVRKLYKDDKKKKKKEKKNKRLQGIEKQIIEENEGENTNV